jgi:glycosyltransferase involved in cell wall biosynthesis
VHRQGPFDVLHAFWAVPCGSIAALAGRTLGVPVITHIAGGELIALPDIAYGGRRTSRGRAAVLAALGGARCITAASRPILDEARGLGFRAERLPLGVDTRTWPPVPPRPRDSSRPARLIAVGSLNGVKDPRTLLESTRILADDGVDFMLDVVGEDTLDGAPLRWARELDVEDRVRFHGFLPQQRLRPLVEGADVLLHAARHEAGPVVLLEAAVAGVPAVGTRVGHFAEWAPAAAAAVDPGNARSLADAARILLDDDAQRMSITRAAQARALAEDADFTAQRVLDLYHTMVRG